MAKPVYKPSQVLRLVKAGKIADPQPRGEGRITCHPHGHHIIGDTESPTFWSNGSYAYCAQCKRMTLVRITFREFVIDVSGERKRYPDFMED
jgi:hypothetical protein